MSNNQFITDIAVSCNNITKSYKNKNALSDISFEVEKGEIFGIIGPDGAGKTTLFRILTTLILADSGTVKVNGFDVVNEYKSRIRKNTVFILILLCYS
jgi:ABC-type multidrug transport system ATPase subunit